MAISEVESVPSFREVVNGKNLTVVLFSALWCHPCKQIYPEVERLAHRYPKVRFIKVDADRNSEIIDRCFVRALPTFMYCRDGKQLGYTVGADMRDVKAQITRFVTDEEKV